MEDTCSNDMLEQRTSSAADVLILLAQNVGIAMDATLKQIHAEKAGLARSVAEFKRVLTTQLLKGRFGMVSSFLREAKQATIIYIEALCLLVCLYIIQRLRIRYIKTILRWNIISAPLSGSQRVQNRNDADGRAGHNSNRESQYR